MMTTPMPRPIARATATTVACCVGLSLAGCATSPRAALQSAQPVSAASGAASVSDSVTEAQADTLSARLTELSVSMRRTLGARREYESTRNPASLSLTITLRDGDVPRLFRLRDASGVESITDQSGRELLDRTFAFMPSSGTGRDDLLFSTTRNSSATFDKTGRAFQISVPIRQFPTALSTIKGRFILQPLVKEEILAVDLGPLNEPVSPAPGLTVVPKSIDLDTANSYLRSAVFEVNSERDARGREPVTIATIELVDDKGGVIGTLGRREEYLVGQTIRRTFSLAEGSGSRPSKDRTVAAIRLRATTFGEPIDFPFTFQNIDLLRDE